MILHIWREVLFLEVWGGGLKFFGWASFKILVVWMEILGMKISGLDILGPEVWRSFGPGFYRDKRLKNGHVFKHWSHDLDL